MINIIKNSTHFLIKSDDGRHTIAYFIHISDMMKVSNNIVLVTPQGNYSLPYDEILTYDGSPPSGIDALLTAMALLCGIAITVAGASSSNITDLGGNTINLGTGSADTGTQRVIIADDDPLLTAIELNQHHIVGPTVVQGVVDVGVVSDTYVDAGSEIDMTDFNTLTIFCELLIQDSTGVKIKFESVHTAAGTEFDGIEDDQYIYAFSNINQNKKIVFKTNNGTPLIQLKTKAVVIGVTEATMAIKCVKSWE